jgi:hypothetical protein
MVSDLYMAVVLALVVGPAFVSVRPGETTRSTAVRASTRAVPALLSLTNFLEFQR